MLYISICLTLIVILLALFMLAKIKSESLGPFYRWIALLVLLAAGIILAFQVARGVKRKMRSGKCADTECTSDHKGNHQMKRNSKSKMMMRHDKNANCPMMEKCGKGMSKEECAVLCKNMGIENCCSGDMVDCPMHDGETAHHVSTTDTIDGKIIKKEIEIIEKKK